MSPNIRWSTFRSAEDNSPVPHSGTWEEFSALLTTIHRPPTSGRLANEKKGMPSFSGTIFRENARRATDTAETIHCLAFDFDNATEVPSGEFWDEGKTRPKFKKVPTEIIADLDEVSALLVSKNITFRAYTTWSSKPGWERFRLVVPLRVPLTPDIWEAAGEVAIRELGLEKWRKCIDMKVLRDTARMNFLPGSPDESTIRFAQHDGDFFQINPDGLDRMAVPPIPKNNYLRVKPPEEIDWIQYGVDMTTMQLRSLLENLGCVVGRPRQLEDGGLKHRTTCPWGVEHGHGADSDDAVVIETPGKWPHFGCAHAGHAHMGLQEVVELALSQGINLRDYAQALESTAEDAIERLDNESTPGAIRKALAAVAKAPFLIQDRLLKRVKQKTGASLQAVRAEFDKVNRKEAPAGQTEDLGRRIAEDMLDKYFAGGAHLIQALDKSWWVYTGTHWKRMANDNALKHYLLDMIKLVKTDSTESSVLESAFKILSALQARDQDLLRLSSVQPRVVNCRNGELWISDKGDTELRPHRADSYLTYVLEVDYDPKATCPGFEKALQDTFSNSGDPEDMVRHFTEFMGYAIQPRRDQKTWWLFQGSGDNGKTKVMQTVQRMMNTSCVFPVRIKDAEKSEHSRANMAGKLLLLDDDVDTGTVLPDGFLKQVSEDKLMSGRNLYQSHFEFISTVVPVLLCNNYPSCRDLSQATQKRAMIVPFDRKFDRSIANPYPHIWEKEMGGVLNLALAGYRRLQERGHFLEPQPCLAAKKRFLSAANPLVDFVETRCEVDASYQVPSTEFYATFRSWSEAEGHTFIPRKGDVERDMVSLGYGVAMDSHLKQKVVRGIRPLDIKGGNF